jgi:tRNA (guanine37-N1)-methyltransferase
MAACILSDSIIRLIPGVISDETSALSDSFQDNILAPPIYTRPSKYNEWEVPKILLSGDPIKIEKWREEQAIERTTKLRPDLMK